MGEGGGGGFNKFFFLPAIVRQLRPHVLEVVVPHVVDAEDVDVGVLRDAIADVGVEPEGQFFALFLRFGEVHDFGALGFGHFEEGGKRDWRE